MTRRKSESQNRGLLAGLQRDNLGPRPRREIKPEADPARANLGMRPRQVRCHLQHVEARQLAEQTHLSRKLGCPRIRRCEPGMASPQAPQPRPRSRFGLNFGAAEPTHH